MPLGAPIFLMIPPRVCVCVPYQVSRRLWAANRGLLRAEKRLEVVDSGGNPDARPTQVPPIPLIPHAPFLGLKHGVATVGVAVAATRCSSQDSGSGTPETPERARMLLGLPPRGLLSTRI